MYGTNPLNHAKRPAQATDGKFLLKATEHCGSLESSCISEVSESSWDIVRLLNLQPGWGEHQTYEKNFEICGGALRNAQYASSHSRCGSGSQGTELASGSALGAG